MTDPVELELKAEIDRIMQDVDDIMKKIDIAYPSKEEEHNSQRE